MSNFRLLLPLLLAALLPLLSLAQDPTFAPPPVPPEPPTEAELTLDEALAKIHSLENVRASVRQEVDMLGQVFTIEGEYARSGPYTFSLDLQVQGLPQAQGRMRQVSDGNVLWDVSQILDQTYYYRLALPTILERINQEPYEALHRNHFIQQRLGLSGPHWLLDGLRQSVRFDRRLEGEWDGRPVWILRGNWKDMNAMGLAPMASVPAYIPSVVELQIDKETGWPYQVLMLGKKRAIVRGANTPKVDPATGRPLGNVAADDEPPSRFLLTYTDVDFDPEFQTGEFSFNVPEMARDRVSDRTEALIAEAEQFARLIEAANLQAGGEGASDPGAVLKDVLQIPPIGSELPPSPPGQLNRPTPPGN
ncbi:hypothetical protein AB1L88_01490 [Tautonia sp. JC769]|uniref:hypothetical protein n=1 Tax=Tautonia sp. JC769 TaxID=3232135 RepID=UPI00345B0869